MKNDKTKQWIEILTIVACFAVAFSMIFLAVYEPAHVIEFWIGDKTGLEILAAILTPIIATIAAWIALHGHSVSKAAAASTRFQKGVELVGEPKASAQTGGITLLQDVASEYPDDYILPVAMTLASLVKELSEPLWEKYYRCLVEGNMGDEDWPPTPLAALEALIVMSHTPKSLRWPRTGFGAERRVRIHRPYFCGWIDSTGANKLLRFEGVNFQKINIDDAVFRDVLFVDCTFIDCRISGLSAGVVRFEGGTIDSCVFQVTRPVPGHAELYGVDVTKSRWHDYVLTGNERI